MDSKQKMIDVVGKACNREGIAKRCPERIADALIAAGLGDVKEKDKRIAVLERALAKAISGSELLNIVCGGDTEQCNDCLICYYDQCIEEAEQELAEEKK